MDSPIKESGKITKCTALENSTILKTKYATKDNFKLECLTASELNTPTNKYLKESNKSTKPLYDCIRAVGSSMRAGLTRINAKDQVKLISRMVYGLETLRMDNLMDMEYGRLMMEKNLRESGRMDATSNLRESIRKYLFNILLFLHLK
jgi:hypothetical protein